MWLRGVMFAACARALQQTCVSPGACRNIRLSAARDAFFLSSFSDGVLGQPETGELLKAAVQERAAGERVRFAYVPTAGYALRKDSNRTPGVQRQRARRDGKQKRDRVVDFLGGPTACDALTLDLCDASIKHAVGSDLPTDGADVLGAWDPHLVLVDGGNTFWLRHYMEDWMDAFAASTAVYVGVSAGAICAGKHVDTALWKGWDDPTVVDERDWTAVPGLDLAGGASFFPHYSDQYTSLVAERTEARHDPLVALDEGGCHVLDREGGQRYVLDPDAPPYAFGGPARDGENEGPARPKLIVFDLDQTLWVPELYKLRRLPNYESAGPPGPAAGADVELLPGAEAALTELVTDEAWRGVKLAVASRTNKAPWARSLLKQFEVAGRSLDDLFEFQECYPGDKTQHFESLRKRTGVDYADMLFFDDARDGRYGNCAIVARLGVCSAHVPAPDGLTSDLWRHALDEYSRRRLAGEPTGVVVDGPGVAAAAPGDVMEATIKAWRPQKNFGFVAAPGVKGDVFFHGSRVAANVALDVGSRVRVRIGVDKSGRRQCDAVEPVDGGGDSSGGSGDVVEMSVFSMNMPFAGLVAHGTKTLETRNGTMFLPLEGQEVLLHVGRRTYPRPAWKFWTRVVARRTHQRSATLGCGTMRLTTSDAGRGDAGCFDVAGTPTAACTETSSRGAV
mmetsp:Transcript_10306/g.31181  ORF Transcript_10306/g.31181 Transcript_10306/m.31181 type:complete len:678 (-) Transcript_10306:338-2371(-)